MEAEQNAATKMQAAAALAAEELERASVERRQAVEELEVARALVASSRREAAQRLEYIALPLI